MRLEFFDKARSIFWTILYKRWLIRLNELNTGALLAERSVIYGVNVKCFYLNCPFFEMGCLVNQLLSGLKFFNITTELRYKSTCFQDQLELNNMISEWLWCSLKTSRTMSLGWKKKWSANLQHYAVWIIPESFNCISFNNYLRRVYCVNIPRSKMD